MLEINKDQKGLDMGGAESLVVGRWASLATVLFRV